MKYSATHKWISLIAIVLAVILVPYFFFAESVQAWTEQFMASARDRPVSSAVVLGSLLAVDILLPVPSSIISTAAGYVLGFAGGLLVSTLGMTVCCLAGAWLGSRPGRAVAGKILGGEEIDRLERLSRRFGDWAIVVARPVPVLAEASVLFAGMSRMPVRRLLVLCALSNLAISAVHSAVGAFAATRHSFLLACVGSIVLPALAIVLSRRRRRTPRTD
ncbi:MAG: VTT domain-containing protein [Lentisphaerae bacterium]|nr:VTT domain-containing protein [Lentisphaerota bacterium]